MDGHHFERLGTRFQLGGSGFPSTSTDQAAINLSANNPVSLSTTDLLGIASGNALTIGTIAELLIARDHRKEY